MNCCKKISAGNFKLNLKLEKPTKSETKASSIENPPLYRYMANNETDIYEPTQLM